MPVGGAATQIGEAAAVVGAAPVPVVVPETLWMAVWYRRCLSAVSCRRLGPFLAFRKWGDEMSEIFAGCHFEIPALIVI